MQTAPLPANEALRLAALDSFDLMHTPAEERFDRITRIAAHALQAPISLISLIGATQQWFKSRVGLALDGTSRDISFCAHAMLQERPLIIDDALLDPRFFDNPLVVGGPYIRFYAGVPLRLADGLMAGALCVIDTVPRALSERELAVLVDLGSMAEFELRQEVEGAERQSESCLLAHGTRSALLDALTGCWNRAGFEALLQAEIEHAQDNDLSFALIVLMLDNYRALSEIEGTRAERLLIETASRLRRVLRGAGTLTRIGEDNFALLVAPCDKLTLSRVLRRVRAAVSRTPYWLDSKREICLSASVGASMIQRPTYDGAQALVDADRRLNLARRVRQLDN